VLTFVKFGGSLITDKRVEGSFRETVMARLASEIKSALSRDADLQLLIGHGSGSFGHFAAKRHDTINGVYTSEAWLSFAQVARAAAELNYRVADVLVSAGVPVMRFQPSASAVCDDGVLSGLDAYPIVSALDHGLVPLIYGDVSFDRVRGGTIVSTESLFFYLAQRMPVGRILLLGEVSGVYDDLGQVIPLITSDMYLRVSGALAGSSGTDVTGGMYSKVSDMIRLAQLRGDLIIRIFDGTQPGLLEQTLLNQAQPGTLIQDRVN
jgi:isopentenyl phosphate kinase